MHIHLTSSTQPQAPFLSSFLPSLSQTMLDLKQGLNPSELTHRLNGDYQPKTMNFDRKTRRTPRNYENYGEGIEFRASKEEESGVISPPLWKTSPPTSPLTEVTPLQSRPYNHHQYHILSPTSRSQAIVRGRQELMEMVKSMPESSYELSLKDLVEHPKVQGIGQKTVVEERELRNDSIGRGQNKKKKKKNRKAQMSRSESMNNEPFLLKMFFPTIWGQKKKSSTTSPCSKVSPRPPSVEGEKGVDKEWWKKRFLSSGENENNGSDSMGGSISSSNSSRSRKMSDFVPSCWSFCYTKKSKTKG